MPLLRRSRQALADITVLKADAKAPTGALGARSTSGNQPMGIFEEQIGVWTFVFKGELLESNSFPKYCHKSTVIRQCESKCIY